MSINKNINRRDFVKKSAVGLTAMSVPAASYARIFGANERINLGIAGLNGRGQAHILAASQASSVNIMALCDADNLVFGKSQLSLKKLHRDKARVWRDVRKLLENKDLDALTIATPDHWHTPMAIMAMQAGKHVYLEKPCCHNPQEGEWLVAVQQKTGKVLQIGNQQRSAPTSMLAKKDIAGGIIGEVYYGKAWYSNTRGSIGMGRDANNPDWLDWELWQGPAPRRQYRDNVEPYNWHWFWHWGTGEINNNGLHEIDICRWMLGVDLPNKVTSSGGRFAFKDDWEFYDTQVAGFEFSSGKMISWEGRSCNGLKHYDRGRGATIHGTEGSILLDRNAYFAWDKKGNLLKQVNERSYSATTDTTGIGGLDVYHMKNFMDAIRNGATVNSPAAEAHKSTLMCHLGNIAQRFGRTLHLDETTGRILDDNEAMTMWGREYQPGWKPVV